MFTFTLFHSLKGIVDSMQLDSGTRIAKLETDKYILSVDVVGDVRVLWNPNPDKSWEDAGTELYKSPSQFPDELMRLFAEGRADGLKNLEIGNNNWFEATLSEKPTGTIVLEDVWDMEDETPGDILNSMCDVIAEYEKEFVSEPVKVFRVTGIHYETDGNDVALPSALTVACASEDDVADAVSDRTGWLVKSIDGIEEVGVNPYDRLLQLFRAAPYTIESAVGTPVSLHEKNDVVFMDIAVDPEGYPSLVYAFPEDPDVTEQTNLGNVSDEDLEKILKAVDETVVKRLFLFYGSLSVIQILEDDGIESRVNKMMSQWDAFEAAKKLIAEHFEREGEEPWEYDLDLELETYRGKDVKSVDLDIEHTLDNFEATHHFEDEDGSGNAQGYTSFTL